MATRRILTGTVSTFDDRVGLGSVGTADGAEHPFHCTAILDGTRTIAEGTPVAFELSPRAGGRWEATRLRPV
jgi:cold shock CspA family protein